MAHHYMIKLRIMISIIVNYFMQLINLYFNLNNLRLFDCRQTNNKKIIPLEDYSDMLKELELD